MSKPVEFLEFAVISPHHGGGEGNFAQWLADKTAHRRKCTATTDCRDYQFVLHATVGETVNTMPEKTIDAVADHGVVTGDTVTGRAAEAQEVFDKLADIGIDLPDVFKVLEDEGVEKFEKSWLELLDATKGQLDAAGK